MKTITLEIEGMTCGHCANTLSNALELEEITEKTVRYENANATITFDNDKINLNLIIETIQNETNYKVKQEQL
ncbi:MAG: heavy-metal-associated domain-containing protein [Bacteroidia bacterium]|nr:heavy-metal-associated domain-containing protein [Bacteroidia bacterium]